MANTFIKKINGYNIYSVPDEYGRTHLVAYLNKKKVADELYICMESEELKMAYQHLVGIANRNAQKG